MRVLCMLSATEVSRLLSVFIRDGIARGCREVESRHRRSNPVLRPCDEPAARMLDTFAQTGQPMSRVWHAVARILS